MDHTIRPLLPEDINSVARLARDVMAHPWNRDQFAAELAVSGGVQLVAGGKRLIGAAVFRLAVDEAELLQLMVAPGLRRRGIGRSLLMAGHRQMTALGAGSCFLEVRRSNQAARALYRAVGYRRIGMRRRYYSQPVEDAVLKNILLGGMHNQ